MMKTQRLLLLLTLLILAGQWSFGQSDDIQLNQVGFYPTESKVFVVRGSGSLPFYLISTASQDTVYDGLLSAQEAWPHSGELVSRGNFSAFVIPGRYVVEVPGVGRSHPFDIALRIHQDLARSSLKAYYFQRASTPLAPQHALQWARGAGHPDTSVFVHVSAATITRPESSMIAAPQGWYDAGDYNKYVVNSGISTYTLLAAYEHFPEYLAELRTIIPESDNSIPDILDEALWNIRWLLAMQDPEDGGVYTKLTNREHDYYLFWLMPAQDVKARYVVMKSTGATLDFSAVMAQASRIFAAHPSLLPGLADSCLSASLAAWTWARQHPDVVYDQTLMNQLYDPNITTGQYADSEFGDEFDWAAAELFITTTQDSFLTVTNPLDEPTAIVPNWQFVRTLGLYSLAQHRASIAATVDTTLLKTRLLDLADQLRAAKGTSAYDVVMGIDGSDFVWGSNAVAANQGMLLLAAYRLTGDRTYLDGALANLDYLLGRNGTGYSFVTGSGSTSPLDIHHRPSQVDGVQPPIPGFLVGGPNPGQQDGRPYPSSMPALSYTDDFLAYSSNEVAINYNAPLVYLAAGLEAILSPNGMPTEVDEIEPRDVPGDFAMLQSYPNPFNPVTTIEYRIPRAGYTTLEVFDLMGRRVRTLEEGWLPAGLHRAQFDASNLPSGVYLGRLMGAGVARHIKMVVTK